MIRPRTPRREQLGEFLATRRRALRRADLGLPQGARRRETGLSREEVSALAGVSVSWYTWLEQGRDINVSKQVLAAVSRVLHLSPDETDYVVALAAPAEGAEDPAPETAPQHLQRLVDALPFPAFIVASDWAIVGWNGAYAALYPPIASLPPADRNLIWLVYTDPRLREILPDWERDSRSFLAEFRTESGVRLSSDRHRALIARLLEASAEFRAHWAEHAIERFTSRQRVFVRAGREHRFEHHRLVPSDASGLHVIAYVPVG